MIARRPQRLSHYYYRARIALLALLSLAPSLAAARAARQDAQPLSLEQGKAVEREIAGAATHRYQIKLEQGQCAYLIIDQRGVDVVEAVIDPEGKKIVEASLPDRTQGPEPLYVVARAGGTYRIEVRPFRKEAPAGRYHVSLEAIRQAAPEDRFRAEAQGAFNEGIRLYKEQTAESRRGALEKFLAALAQWKAAGEREREADALNSIGLVYSRLGDNKKALDYLNEALQVRRAVKDLNGEALTLNNIGTIIYAMGDKRAALDHFNQALSLNRALSESDREAVTTNNVAACHADLGDSYKALDYYGQAAAKLHALGNGKEEANTLSNMGIVYNQVGENQKALDHYNRALSFRRAEGEREGTAITQLNIAKVYDDLGERQKALDTLAESLAGFRLVGNRRFEALALNNTGHVYWLLGDYQKALGYYGEALTIARAASDSANEALLLNNIGKVYDDQGERQKALEHYERALTIWRVAENPRMQAVALGNIGKTFQALGERQKALDYYTRALALNRSANSREGEAVVLHNMGVTYASLGDKEKALANLDQALAISRDIKEPRVEAQTLYRIAIVERDRGNLAAARARMEEALPIVESLRSDVKSPQLRAAYFASVRSYYDTQIDLFMRMHRREPSAGFDALALQTSERARARNLLEILVESHADIRQGIDGQLLARERGLQQLLNAKAALQTRLLNRRADERAAAVAKEITALATEYQQVEAAIRQKSPRYAALTRPAPLSLKEIQQQALDGETLLLEYALGDERSYVWAVTTTTIEGYELPARSVIDDAARRFYKLITAQNEQVAGESLQQRQARLARAEADYDRAASDLSQMVLGPVAGKLGDRRLMIVAEGALQYVPFAALPAPQGTAVRDRGSEVGERRMGGVKPSPSLNLATDHRPPVTAKRPLILDHEIVSMPSASTLVVLRREVGRRAPAPKLLAIIADPVFDKDDPRVKAGAGGQPTAVGKNEKRSVMNNTDAGDRDRAGDGDADLRIPRLPLTREEAAAVAGLVSAADRKEALDFDASRRTATSGELAKYRYVHFATHGLLDSEHPELSTIVLSLVDKDGRAEDGFLRLHEIYNLSLPAELVVLSACRTALGKEIKGEGLVGLTRGFMYAGAARVVASLWKIDDRATAELMKRFYQAMLGGNPMRPAAALRAAQIDMMKKPRWQSPYYWAAFVHQGEWR